MVRVASAVARDRDPRIIDADDAGRVGRHQLLPELAPAGSDFDPEHLPGQLLLAGDVEVPSVSAPLIEAVSTLQTLERRARSAVERQDEAFSTAHVKGKPLPVGGRGESPERLFTQDEARLAAFERENPEAGRFVRLGSRDEERASVRQDPAAEDVRTRQRDLAAGDGQAW